MWPLHKTVGHRAVTSVIRSPQSGPEQFALLGPETSTLCCRPSYLSMCAEGCGRKSGTHTVPVASVALRQRILSPWLDSLS